MRISIKSRYALAAMEYLASRHGGEQVSAISVAEALGISKIYLEQIFSALKKAGLVNSVKGAQGGYVLALPPDKITAYDILGATDSLLFEDAGETVREKTLDKAIKGVIGKMDECVKRTLSGITLSSIVHDSNQSPMFYI